MPTIPHAFSRPTRQTPDAVQSAGCFRAALLDRVEHLDIKLTTGGCALMATPTEAQPNPRSLPKCFVNILSTAACVSLVSVVAVQQDQQYS